MAPNQRPPRRRRHPLNEEVSPRTETTTDISSQPNQPKSGQPESGSSSTGALARAQQRIERQQGYTGKPKTKVFKKAVTSESSEVQISQGNAATGAANHLKQASETGKRPRGKFMMTPRKLGERNNRIKDILPHQHEQGDSRKPPDEPSPSSGDNDEQPINQPQEEAEQEAEQTIPPKAIRTEQESMTENHRSSQGIWQRIMNAIVMSKRVTRTQEDSQESLQPGTNKPTPSRIIQRSAVIGELIGLGGTDEVGASCHLYALGRTRLLIDCGTRPGKEGIAKLPNLEVLRQLKPDHMLLTHAHLDHVGALPHLIRQHPKLRIMCTPETAALAELVMRDALKIEQLGPRGSQTQDQQMVEAAIRALTPSITAGRSFSLGDIQIIPHRAGHLLGAVGYTLIHQEGIILHAGDFNHQNSPTAQGLRVGAEAGRGDLQLPRLGKIDVLITEATYGGRQVPTRDSQTMRMGNQVRIALQRGGMVLIPSFALGRSQDVTWYLRQLMERNVIPKVPIRLDGMVRDATRIHERFSGSLPMEAVQRGGTHPFTGRPVEYLNARTRERLLDQPTPGITIASSGMLTAGASPIHARTVLEREQDLLLVVGYQDAESPGKRIQEAKPGDRIRLNDRDKVTIKCQVETLGISAHADHQAITRLVNATDPGSVILVHGDDNARKALGEQIASSRETYTPERLASIQLRRSGSGPGGNSNPSTPAWLRQAIEDRQRLEEKERKKQDSGNRSRIDNA